MDYVSVFSIDVYQIIYIILIEFSGFLIHLLYNYIPMFHVSYYILYSWKYHTFIYYTGSQRYTFPSFIILQKKKLHCPDFKPVLIERNLEIRVDEKRKRNR